MRDILSPSFLYSRDVDGCIDRHTSLKMEGRGIIQILSGGTEELPKFDLCIEPVLRLFELGK